MRSTFLDRYIGQPLIPLQSNVYLGDLLIVCFLCIIFPNTILQEVEVLNLDMSHDMGSAVVDVKGFRLLKKCATALRSRRNVG